MSKRSKHKGFLMTELIVAMTVLAIILICLAFAMKAFRKINNYQLVRQQCISAAQAQLDSIAAAGRSIDNDNSKRLWPKVDIQIEQSNGTGQWEGMKLIKVKASAHAANKAVSVELAGYFALQGEIRQ